MRGKHARAAVGFTVRGVPQQVASVLRRQARARGMSLNAVLVEALTRAAGLEADAERYRDLDDLAGTWVEDPAFDEAIRAQDQVDESLWR